MNPFVSSALYFDFAALKRALKWGRRAHAVVRSKRLPRQNYSDGLWVWTGIKMCFANDLPARGTMCRSVGSLLYGKLERVAVEVTIVDDIPAGGRWIQELRDHPITTSCL